MDVKGERTLTTFLQKQVKKCDQNVSRAKIFSLFIVKFKKLGFSAPLTFFWASCHLNKITETFH